MKKISFVLLALAFLSFGKLALADTSNGYYLGGDANNVVFCGLPTVEQDHDMHFFSNGSARSWTIHILQNGEFSPVDSADVCALSASAKVSSPTVSAPVISTPDVGSVPAVTSDAAATTTASSSDEQVKSLMVVLIDLLKQLIQFYASHPLVTPDTVVTVTS